MSWWGGTHNFWDGGGLVLMGGDSPSMGGSPPRPPPIVDIPARWSEESCRRGSTSRGGSCRRRSTSWGGGCPASSWEGTKGGRQLRCSRRPCWGPSFATNKKINKSRKGNHSKFDDYEEWQLPQLTKMKILHFLGSGWTLDIIDHLIIAKQAVLGFILVQNLCKGQLLPLHCLPLKMLGE